MGREVEMANGQYMKQVNSILVGLIATWCIASGANAEMPSKNQLIKQRVHAKTTHSSPSGRLLAQKPSGESKKGNVSDTSAKTSAEGNAADKNKHSLTKDTVERSGVKPEVGKEKKGFWPIIKSAKPKQPKPSSERSAAQDAGGKEKPKTEDKVDDTTNAGRTSNTTTQDKLAPTSSAGGVAASSGTDEIEPLLPEAGLISLLKDLSRALKDSDEVTKIESSCQRAAVSVATLALAKAVESPDLLANRIIVPAEKEKLQSTMTSESWASGDIVLSNNCHASLSAVWAKKVEGLINIAIAGNCGCKPSPVGDSLGEFVVVVNGKSSIDSGFDIQSQSNVEFWLGKLGTVAADASCCMVSDSQKTNDTQSVPGLSKVSQRSTVVLKAVLTEKSRNYFNRLAAFKERQRLAAITAEKERIEAEQKAKVASDKPADNGEASTEVDAKPKVISESATATIPLVANAPPAVISELSPDAAKTKLPTRVEDPRTTAVKSDFESSAEIAFQHATMPSYG
ncbi:MAG: hypothetical protein HY711_10430, partial [Candidatus Melainabacteria bacterium]|nr:hypothetical protein [Candidatus Melainabacteria bacterium]